MVLELTSTCIENISEVFIVSRMMKKYKKTLKILSILIVEYKDNFFPTRVT